MNSHLRAADGMQLAALGLRARRTRTFLSAIAIAIGVATMVAVLGISTSSRARLVAQLDALGTNLLTVSPGRDFGGENIELPAASAGMVNRIQAVQNVTPVAELAATVRRSDRIPANNTGALTVMASGDDLVATVGAPLAAGRFLDAALSRYPAVVLGGAAARQLGIGRVDGSSLVFVGNHYFVVVGILGHVDLVPELDRAAFIGYPVAEELFKADGAPSALYIRTDPSHVPAVERLLTRTVSPAHPDAVQVTRPSDALAARAAADNAFTALLLGIGAVALLVGALGVANVMVIAVLERRNEIGVRRALGATRAHIGVQFLGESFLLAVLGGGAGVLAGAAVTAVYAAHRGWLLVLPSVAVVGGLGVAAVVGAIAGLYPALRAARLAPTTALRST